MSGEVEVTDKSGMIEANSKLLVRRLPMKELEPIELDYQVDRVILYNTGTDVRPITTHQYMIRQQSL